MHCVGARVAADIPPERLPFCLILSRAKSATSTAAARPIGVPRPADDAAQIHVAGVAAEAAGKMPHDPKFDLRTALYFICGGMNQRRHCPRIASAIRNRPGVRFSNPVPLAHGVA
jgi:hypothetical protein